MEKMEESYFTVEELLKKPEFREMIRSALCSYLDQAKRSFLRDEEVLTIFIKNVANNIFEFSEKEFSRELQVKVRLEFLKNCEKAVALEYLQACLSIKKEAIHFRIETKEEGIS